MGNIASKIRQALVVRTLRQEIGPHLTLNANVIRSDDHKFGKLPDYVRKEFSISFATEHTVRHQDEQRACEESYRLIMRELYGQVREQLCDIRYSMVKDGHDYDSEPMRKIESLIKELEG
jgi:hypothetical protein